MNPMYKNQPWIGIAIVTLFLLVGFMGGAVKKAETVCTLKACECVLGQLNEGQLKFQPIATGEISCNECGTTDHIFFTGLVNLTKNCAGQEMIQCRNGKSTGSRIDIDEESCKYNFSFLSK